MPKARLTRYPAARVAVASVVAVVSMSLVVAVTSDASAQPAAVSDDTAAVRGVVYATYQDGGLTYVGGDFDFAGRWSGAGATVDTKTGHVAAPGLRIQGTVYSATPDGQGGWFIGGDFTQVLGQPRSGLARITGTGKLSPFRADVEGVVKALAFNKGVVYVGGNLSGVGGISRSNLAAVAAATSATTAWNPRSNGQVLDLAVKGKRVYVGGSFSRLGGKRRNALGRVRAANGAITGWNPKVAGEVRDIAVKKTRITFGGDFSAVGGVRRANLASVGVAGASPTAWAPNPDGAVNAIATRKGDPRIFVGGSFSTVAGRPRANLAAVADNGNVDGSWSADTDGQVFDLDVDASGDLFATGSFTAVNSIERLRGAGVDSSGALTDWDPATDEDVRVGVVSSDQIGSRVLLGGSFSYVNGAARRNLAAIDSATGDVVRTFKADTNGRVKALTASTDGSQLFAGGAFTTVEGLFRSRLAGLDPDTGQPLPWSVNAVGSVNGLATAGDWLFVGGGFGSIGNEPIAYLARVDVSSHVVDSAFNPSPDGVVRALEVTNDGTKLFAVGEFDNVGAQTRNGAALLEPSSGAVESFRPTSGGTGIAADLSPDESRFYFTTTSNRIYAYDYGSSNAPTWSQRTDGDIQAVAATVDEVYIGGHWSDITAQDVRQARLASLYALDGTLTPWAPGANGSFGVWAMTATSDSLLIGGDFTKTGGRRQPGFARYVGAP